MIQSTDKNLVLFANQYPTSIAADLLKIASDLDLKVIPADIGSFKSLERYCELYPNQKHRFIENKAEIQGAHVHVVMNIQEDPNIAFVDALNTVTTVRKHGAKSVHLVTTPVYARQDREMEARMCSVMSETYVDHLRFAGVKQISAIDMHSKDGKKIYVDCFGKQNVHFISAVQEIADTLKDSTVKFKCSAPDGYDKPDDAAQERVRDFKQIAFGEDYLDSNQDIGIVKAHISANETVVEKFVGDVDGCDVILLDDVFDTCTTIKNAADVMKQNGASSVIIAATHAGFSDDSLNKLTSETVMIGGVEKQNPIDRIIVTDTILSVHDKYNALSENQKEMVTIIPVTSLIRRALSLKF